MFVSERNDQTPLLSLVAPKFVASCRKCRNILRVVSCAVWERACTSVLIAKAKTTPAAKLIINECLDFRDMRTQPPSGLTPISSDGRGVT